ncbi:hypothetical protein QR46_2531 [Giardia duodenalis assemblage B]|uniref:Variant-specific surface protein n=1 Tax=Giardia duodenalis assemblage B TaxID=1394984 RepID=A0A132NTS4_GIAIN|nr:hypothetical protein QR46_2531 [Giardia intestinalis assemblage B]
MCREARGGACVWYAKEDKTDRTSAGVIRAGAGDTCIQETTSGTPESTKCKTGKCDVTIGDNPYCSQCSKDTEFPINGVCTATIDGNTGCSAGGVCTQCKDGYFLHKGGCYKKGEEPGSLICKDATGTAGKCQACADGYFKNSDTAATTDSCIGCDDENCAICTEAGNNKCSKCKTTGTKTYLKAESGSTGTCVEASGCGSEFFPKADNSAGNKCISCGSTSGNDGGIADCQTCTKESTTLKCLTCNSDKKPSTDGTKCVTCTVTNCAACSADNICEVCTDGYRKNGSNCEKCTVDKCKACTSDAKICTECVTGYAPSADGSSCASSSANKTGLSTGAIAGISVVVIAVVGGLVGFLCWWFVCRGKA